MTLDHARWIEIECNMFQGRKPEEITSRGKPRTTFDYFRCLTFLTPLRIRSLAAEGFSL